jgi:hypothetical protein
MADIDASTWPPRWTGPNFKGPRGSNTIAKEKAAREETQAEIDIKRDVKARDKKCRWPGKHKCRGGLECAHIIDASRGGECSTKNLVLLCKWIHRSGPESIHGKELEVRILSKKGADGPLSFHRKAFSETKKAEYIWRTVGKETAPGVLAE